MNPKVMNKWGAAIGRKKPTHCQRDDCSTATREGKPYCSDHIESLSYVQVVQERIAKREAEIKAVAKRGARAVDPHGIVARDVLCSLWVHGERSVARLSRELNVDFEVLLHFVSRLKKRKEITQTSPRRGAGKVKLVAALAEIQDPRELGRPAPAEVAVEVAPAAQVQAPSAPVLVPATEIRVPAEQPAELLLPALPSTGFQLFDLAGEKSQDRRIG